jgi:hypothetical protein
MLSPVGSWLAKVARPSGTVEIGLHFAPDGLVFLVRGAHGGGVWRVQKTILWYRIREAMLDDDGNYLGYIDIRQSGEVSAGHLASTGESRVYANDGTLIRTVPISITALPK